MQSNAHRITRWRLPADCYAERDLQEVAGIILHYISALNVDPRRWGSTDAARKLLIDFNRTAARRSWYTFEPATRMHGSYHYLVGRRGGIYELVPLPRVAWHAGSSALGGRSGCNEFCVGIGLVATADSGFTAGQYAALKGLIDWLRAIHPTIEPAAIQGHEHVAIPAGRKSDPGPHFDWHQLDEVLQ